MPIPSTRAADHTGRQLMDQAVFEAIWISDDDIEAARVRPGLAKLVSATWTSTWRDEAEAVEAAPRRAWPTS